MSAITFPQSVPIAAPSTSAGAHAARLHWSVVIQTSICAIPAMALCFFGQFWPGARYIMAALGLLLVWNLYTGRKHESVALLLGCIPVLSFFRGFFFYYAIMVFLGAAIALWVARSPAILTTFWRDIAWRYFICAGLVYWWISYLITGDYTENIRVFELLLCAIGTFLAGTRRSWIASALLSMAISSSALAIGFLPYSGRLGVAAVADKQFGNPVLIGLPTAMVLLLSVADNGSWMLLDKRPFLRFVVSVSAGEWLILSGSRGAWAAAIAGLFVVMVIDKRARGPLIVAFMLLGMVTAVMLTSHRGAQAALQFEKTIDSGRSIANRTSGRSEQWRAIPQVFLESPLWGWGPGSGKEVVALYTGRHLAWHSLFLNIIGETGLIGLIAVGIIFGSLLSRDLRCWRQWGEITPLVATIAYLVIGLSVSGMDGVCGILVGLGFLGRGGAPRFIARHGVLRPQQEMPLAEARGSENGR